MPKKRFALALGKDRMLLEQKFVDDVKNFRARLPRLKEIQNERGVRVKNNTLFIDGRLMSKPLLDHLRSISGIYATGRMVTRSTDERLALAKQLNQLGYRPAIGYVEHGMPISKRRIGMAKKHGRTYVIKPDAGDKINGVVFIHPNKLWLRDSWTKIAGKRVNFFGGAEYNAFGEGGRIVELPGKIILASKELEHSPHVKELVQKGYSFYFMRDGFQNHPRLTRALGIKTYVTIDHPDLFVGATSKILLVNKGYFAQNETLLKEVAKKANLEIVFVPASEEDIHPANFLPLSENTILMDKDAKETIKLLRVKGVTVIPTKTSMVANREAGGGVRCIVNEL